jgi:hypothetical protein
MSKEPGVLDDDFQNTAIESTQLENHVGQNYMFPRDGKRHIKAVNHCRRDICLRLEQLSETISN